MKRSILIMLLSVLILLAGCRSDPPEIVTVFDAEVTVSGGSIDCAARVSRRPDTVTVELTAPATVAGITYIRTAGELRTSCGELDCITDHDSLPASSAPQLILEALGRLEEAAFVSSDDGADTYRLSADQGEITLTCADGLPRTLTAAFSPYTVTFTPNQ